MADDRGQLGLRGIPRRPKPTVRVEAILKSGLQKGVRRGKEGVIVWATRRLWQTPEGRNWLMWRIPVIAAEEAWPITAEATWLSKRLEEEARKTKWSQETMVQVIGLVQGIARIIKNKDADGLQGLVGAKGEVRLIPDRLVFATAEKVLGQEAVERMWDELDEVVKNDHHAENIYRAVRWRWPRGGMTGDRRLLVCAAVLAAYQAELVWGLVQRWNPEPVMCEEELPPWTTADMHTGHGKRALYSEAKRLRMAPEALSQLWFLMESGTVDHTSRWSTWWDAFIEYKLMEHGFENVAHAKAKWAEIMPALRDLVIRLCDLDSWSFSG